jgi:hypothetical protein
MVEAEEKHGTIN